jgi:hypothetical protein
MAPLGHESSRRGRLQLALPRIPFRTRGYDLFLLAVVLLGLLSSTESAIVLKANSRKPVTSESADTELAHATAVIDAKTGESSTVGPPELPPLATYPPSSPKAGQPIQPIFEVDTEAPDIQSAAAWAVDYLSKMSDSGAYESIRLHKVLWAATHSGVFHNNTILKLQVTSPDIDSKDGLSTHEIVIMSDLEDPSVRSFSIDDFPVMKEAAIERKWREKAYNHARKREEVFKRLEEEAAVFEAQGASSTGGNAGRL